MYSILSKKTSGRIMSNELRQQSTANKLVRHKFFQASNNLRSSLMLKISDALGICRTDAVSNIKWGIKLDIMEKISQGTFR